MSFGLPRAPEKLANLIQRANQVRVLVLPRAPERLANLIQRANQVRDYATRCLFRASEWRIVARSCSSGTASMITLDAKATGTGTLRSLAGRTGSARTVR